MILLNSSGSVSKIKVFVTGFIVISCLYSCQAKTPTPTAPTPTAPTPTAPTPTTPSPTAPSPTTSSVEKSIAEKSTVFISIGGEVNGSGVIIGRENNTLYVLTVRHVIGIKPGEKEAPYTITTSEGEKFKVGLENYAKTVNFMPNTADLAVLVLKSSEQLSDEDKVATLSSFVEPNMPTYIFGYLPCSSSKSGNKYPTQISKGKILKIESSSNSNFDPQSGLSEYDIYYNNNTVEGMSGSPIFDRSDRVIGLHAKTEQAKEKGNKKCDKLTPYPTDDLGKNWGISIRRFTNLKSALPPSLRDKFVVEQKKNTNPSTPKTPSPDPGNLQPCPPFIGEVEGEVEGEKCKK